MANYTGDYWKLLLLQAAINCSTNTHKAKLMASGYVFNRTTHRKWADVSASELANGAGYTTGGVSLTLSGSTPAEDNTNHLAKITWANPSWVASAGTIGPSAGLMVINDTHGDKPIMLYIPFSPEQSQPDGGTFTVNGVEYDQVDTVTPD